MIMDIRYIIPSPVDSIGNSNHLSQDSHRKENTSLDLPLHTIEYISPLQQFRILYLLVLEVNTEISFSTLLSMIKSD